MTPYYQDEWATLYHGDCLEVVPSLGRFDLVLTDPPYGKVKGAFDDVWTNRPSMLKDCALWRDAIVGAMKPNATLWWFAWPSLAGRIEALIAEKLNPIAHVIWLKPCPTAQKHCPESLRAPASETERVLMFEHYGADNMALGESGYTAKCDELRGFVFEPIRAYLSGEWERAGKSRRDAEKATGTQMASHWFSRVQWELPTAKHYATLKRVANENGGEYLRKEYEELRKEYEELRKEYEELRKEYEELRRYFALKTGDQKTDVWRFKPSLNKHGHPTEKPLALISFMARISCRPAGRILDPFAGSGTTLAAAKMLGRKAVGVEKDERYCEITARRLQQDYLPLNFG